MRKEHKMLYREMNSELKENQRKRKLLVKKPSTLQSVESTTNSKKKIEPKIQSAQQSQRSLFRQKNSKIDLKIEDTYGESQDSFRK